MNCENDPGLKLLRGLRVRRDTVGCVQSIESRRIDIDSQGTIARRLLKSLSRESFTNVALSAESSYNRKSEQLGSGAQRIKPFK